MTAAEGALERCELCPLRRFGFRRHAPEEIAFLRRFKRGERHLPAGATLLREGETSPDLYTVLSGWGFRHKALEDGRRQVLNFAMTGDLLGLQGAIAREMDHSVEALTDMRLCVFAREKLWEVFAEFPNLSFALTWIAAREERMLDGHLLSVGQRTALERLAYLLLHLQDRARFVGLAEGDVLPAPFTQAHLADALGITAVHLSRTLQRLRRAGLVLWRDGTVRLLDRDRLAAVAKYEPLDLAERPYV